MELSNDFRVSVPVEQAWKVLTDLERIAPCMPGAELKEVEGDEYRGIVKVKVGPITAQYRGSARFTELDQAGHWAVLRAEGRDTRGQGNASATVVAQLVPEGDSTHVTITTDLAITGKVAQFGRGVLADVSGKLLGQFVERLEADVLSGGAPSDSETPTGNGSEAAPAADATAGPAEESPVRAIISRPAEPVNLMEAAGGSVAKRAVPAALGVGLLLLIWRLLRRR
jgi:carbon monoxide dehydrogenase subunit G